MYRRGVLYVLLFVMSSSPVALGQPQDLRYCGPPPRDASGVIVRSSAVLRAFEQQYPKPQDGRRWYRDHVIPLACGGCDSVENLQWLPESSWREKSQWERKVYGGWGISAGCP